MSVRNGNAQTLGSDNRFGCWDYNAVLDLTEYAKGLLLALLFLTADIRNEVVYHLGPLVEGLTRTAYRLIGGSNDLFYAVLAQRSKSADVGLYRAVGLNGNKSVLRAESLSLRCYNLKMRVVDLGNYHRDVRRPSVRRVIGYDGYLRLCVSLLESARLVLAHIYRTKDEIYKTADGIHVL